MTTFYYLGGCLVYTLAVVICYLPSIRNSPLYFPLGLTCGLLANWIWLALSKSMTSNESRLIAGFYWDSILVACYALLPVLFFGVRANVWSAAGIALIVVGILLTKVS